MPLSIGQLPNEALIDDNVDDDMIVDITNAPGADVIHLLSKGLQPEMTQCH
jgi:hypothetical protein